MAKFSALRRELNRLKQELPAVDDGSLFDWLTESEKLTFHRLKHCWAPFVGAGPHDPAPAPGGSETERNELATILIVANERKQQGKTPPVDDNAWLEAATLDELKRLRELYDACQSGPEARDEATSIMAAISARHATASKA